MFENRWRKKPIKASQELKKVKQIINQINNERTSRIGEPIFHVLTQFFGSSSNSGLLAQFGKNFHLYQPTQWIHELQQRLDIIKPDSTFMDKVMKFSEARIILGEKYFPSTFNLAKYNFKNIDIREAYNGYSVTILDSYFILLINAIYLQQPQNQHFSEHQKLTQDDFFAKICRNPLLRLLKLVLQYFENKKIEIQKLIDVMKIYFIDEVIDKYEKDSKNIKPDNLQNTQYRRTIRKDSIYEKITSSIRRQPLKYRLKQNHLLSIYLAVKYGPQHFVDLKRYILGICQNFSSIFINDTCLYALLRIWMFSISTKDIHNMEFRVIQALNKSNSKDGWFELERYQFEKHSGTNYITPSMQIIIKSLLELFEKDSNWSPNCTYIYIISIFFNILDYAKFYSNSLDNSKRHIISDLNQQSREELIIKKICQRINKNLVNIVVDYNRKAKREDILVYRQNLDRKLQMIEDYFTKFVSSKNSQKYGRSYPQMNMKLFKFNTVSDQDLFNHKRSQQITSSGVETDEKMKLISFYRRKPKTVWQVPIQYYQSSILFYLFYGIAKMIDVVIPGKRKEPVIKIRFLANPIYFGVLVIVVLILLKIFL